MDNLEAALRAAGAELRDVAKTAVYVASERREDLVTAGRSSGNGSATITLPAPCSGSACSGTETN